MSIENSHVIDKKMASAIISRLHVAYGIDEKWGSLGDLAKCLETSASVISGWKKRGIPRERLKDARIDTGYLEHWLETGEGPRHPHSQVKEHTPDYSHGITLEQMTNACRDLEKTEQLFGRHLSPEKRAQYLLDHLGQDRPATPHNNEQKEGGSQ